MRPTRWSSTSAEQGSSLPTDKYRLTLLGNGSQVLRKSPGPGPRRREYRQRQSRRGPAPAPLGRRLPGRQLLRQLHHQHDAPDRDPRQLQAGAGQRHQYRRRLRHHHDAAQLRRLDHRAQPGARPAGRPDRDLDIGMATSDGVYFADSPNIPADIFAVSPQQCRHGPHRRQRQFHRDVGSTRRFRAGHGHRPCRLALQRRRQRTARAVCRRARSAGTTWPGSA